MQQWQPVNWQVYQAAAAATTKAHDFSTIIIALLHDMGTRNFDPLRHTDPRLRAAINYLRPLTGRDSINQTDATRVIRNFLGELENLSQHDVDVLRPQLRYDFFQREIADESKLRAELAKALSKRCEQLRSH